MNIENLQLFETSDVIKVDKIERGNHRSITSNAVSFISTNSTSLQGGELAVGSHIKVLFTNAIIGINAVTPLTLIYNDVGVPVKVGKDGALADVFAYSVSSVFTYIQAYTTIEFMYDGEYLIIIGNPLLISNNGLKVYANGSKVIVSTTAISIGSALDNGTFYFVRSS